MIRPEVLDALLASGATAEMIVAAVKADARQEEARAEGKRQADAERKRKSRAGIASRKSQDVTVTPRDGCDTPPNDIYSNPPQNPVETKVSTPPFAEKVVFEWNDGPAAVGAQRSNPLTPKRRKHLAARVREVGEDGVLAAIRGIAGSDWHVGKGSGDWRADLGWLLENSERVAKFAERAANAPPPAKPITAGDSAAYLASIADKPWMRGRENELFPLPRSGTGPPRSFGQLAAGIAGTAH